MSPRLSVVVFAMLLAIALLAPQTSEAVLTQVFQQTGNLHLEVIGAAGLLLPATGTLTLATAPSGTIKQAYLYATQTNNIGGMSGSFGAGPPLPIVSPHATEALLITLSTYRWDVTSKIIPGVASYGFTVVDALGNPVAVAGVGLVVVWEDAGTEPIRTVTIIDGVKQVGEGGAETESTTFTTLPAGSTTVWVFVTDDDAPSTGETVTYNSSNIGGPLVASLGLNASVLRMTGTSGPGSNTLSISTVTDHLTWVLGATSIDQATVPTEETTWGRIKSLFR